MYKTIFSRNLLFLGFIFVIGGCAPALNDSIVNVTDVKIVEYGISKSEKIKSPDYPNSVAGSVDVVKKEIIVTQTDTIPLKIGLSFGLKYMIVTPDGRDSKFPVTYRVSYPRQMTDPSTGKSEKVWEFKTYSKANDPRYTGFAFDNNYELLDGDWTFEIIVGNHMARQVFHMVK